MALYQHTWGLTAQRKSEYEIMIRADPITKEAYDSERPGASGRPLVGSSRQASDRSEPSDAVSAHSPRTSMGSDVPKHSAEEPITPSLSSRLTDFEHNDDI
jgi:hypothetical protein